MTQKTNDQIILEQIIRDRCNESDDGLSESDYFELYSASEILKNHDLSYDDIRYGIVGNGGDGGIDSIYTFVNGEPLKEDTVLSPKQRKNTIELVLIQSKISSSFSEAAITKFRESAEDLFNLSNDMRQFGARYTADLLDRIDLFRNCYSRFAKNFPSLHIRYCYATQGNDVHPNVEGKVPKLEELIGSLFSGAEFSFEFIGASRLLQMTRDLPSTSRILEVAESPIGTTSGSYLCLVSLSKYFEFVSDEGSLARSIFESNVRDYQGSVTVNTGIRQTLQNAESENFWYLNNGVTVITPKAVLAGKQLTIEDPQIVNGLQTSYEIHNHFDGLEDQSDDERAVLVRVICEQNEEARDRIIRATNSQTSIPPASLRSSDEVHRDIEDFLKSNGYYYDRRKNFYKNEGKPISKIVSIPYMAQAMMASTLLRPDTARARPSTLLNSDSQYGKIFSRDIPIDVYLKVVEIMRAVEGFLKPDRCGRELDRKTINNLKFYVAMMVAVNLTGSRTRLVRALAELPNVLVTDDVLEASLGEVMRHYEELGGTDQVAKGPDLLAALTAS